jgi:hypothetical protein
VEPAAAHLVDEEPGAHRTGHAGRDGVLTGIGPSHRVWSAPTKMRNLATASLLSPVLDRRRVGARRLRPPVRRLLRSGPTVVPTGLEAEDASRLGVASEDATAADLDLGPPGAFSRTLKPSHRKMSCAPTLNRLDP